VENLEIALTDSGGDVILDTFDQFVPFVLQFLLLGGGHYDIALLQLLLVVFDAGLVGGGEVSLEDALRLHLRNDYILQQQVALQLLLELHHALVHSF